MSEVTRTINANFRPEFCPSCGEKWVGVFCDCGVVFRMVDDLYVHPEAAIAYMEATKDYRALLCLRQSVTGHRKVIDHLVAKVGVTPQINKALKLLSAAEKNNRHSGLGAHIMAKLPKLFREAEEKVGNE